MEILEAEPTTPSTSASPRVYAARIARSLGAGAASSAINILVQVVSVPMFLHFWGAELYGEWLLMMTIPAYFAMSDIGFGNIANTEMTMLVAGGDRTRALAVFQSVWVLITAASLALLASAAAVLPWVDLARWLRIAHISHAEVTCVVVVMAAYVLIGQQSSVLWAGYRCEGRNAQGVMWVNLARLVEFVAIVLAVAAGASVLWAAGVMLAARAAVTLLMRLNLLRIAPWLTLGRQHASLALVRRLAGPAVSFMAFPLGTALRMQGVLMVVGNVLGPVAVVAFSTTRTLTNVAFQGLSIVHMAVWPELSAAFGAGDVEMARKLHRKACQASFWLAVVSAIGLLIFGGWVYGVWTRGQVALDYRLFCTLLSVIVVNSLWFTSSAVPMATNTHQRMAIYYLLAAGIALALAYVLAAPLGAAGAALSLLAIDAVMLATVLPQSLRLVHDTFWGYLRAVLSVPKLGMLRMALPIARPAPIARSAAEGEAR